MTQELRVMIIEDDPEIIRLHSIFLKRAGYEPIPALGGRQALRLLEEITVDLILLDLMMPDLDGWAVLRAIRENDKLRTTPVIIVTVRHPLEDQDQVRTFAGQFEGYLMKPFVGESLINLVENTLE